MIGLEMMVRRSAMPLISIVVPFLNESDCILKFCDFIDDVARKKDYKLEIIFSDDGSTDGTVDIIRTYVFKHCEIVKVVSLSKNFGSHAATRAGIQQASGEYCTFVGADLQEPPTMIDEMYKSIKSGVDAVYIDRKSIDRSFTENIFSSIYSKLMCKFAVKNYGTGINNIMFNAKIRNFLNNNIESNSSLNLQIVNAGFKYKTIPMEYRSRAGGRSKWTFTKKLKLFIDSFVAFSFMPIRAVSIVGILLSLIGMIFLIIVVISSIINPGDTVIGYPTIASLILLGFGVTNISLGVIAEYLWRTYDAARKRPVFIVSDIYSIKQHDTEEENLNKEADHVVKSKKLISD
jgi:dolichol-phosphate mannosyltransferase